jgi:uncharacterized protein (DUF1499 family)
VHAIESLSASMAQWDSLKLWLGGQRGWELTVEDGSFMQAVVVTPLMRYRDDVQLLYQADLERIQVRSSSRLGFSDMGTNRSRVEALRSKINQN